MNDITTTTHTGFLRILLSIPGTHRSFLGFHMGISGRTMDIEHISRITIPLVMADSQMDEG